MTRYNDVNAEDSIYGVDLDFVMTTTELRRQLKKSIDALPEEKLRSAADFVRSLRRATDGLPASDRVKIAAMKRRMGKAEKDFAEGRATPVEKLRRKY